MTYFYGTQLYSVHQKSEFGLTNFQNVPYGFGSLILKQTPNLNIPKSYNNINYNQTPKWNQILAREKGNYYKK